MPFYPDISRQHCDAWPAERFVNGINWLPPGNYICDLHGCTNCHRVGLNSKRGSPRPRQAPYSSFRPPYTDDRDFPFYVIAKDPTMSVLDQYYQLSTITRSHGSSNIRFLITDQPQDPAMDELKHEIVDYALTILVKGPKPETIDDIWEHTNRIFYIS